MLYRRVAVALTGAAAFGALAIMPALAAAPAGFVASIGGNYDRGTFSGGGGDVDIWGVSGAGAFGLGTMDLGGELSGGYQNYSYSPGSTDTDTWSIAGSLFWAPMMGRFGGTVGYTTLNFGSGGGDADFVSYGAFAEYYMMDAITVAGRLGGWHLSVHPVNFSDDGVYLGGALTGYVTPDLAIQGSINHINGIDLGYVNAFNVTDFTIGAEFQVSEQTPLTLGGGYTYTSVSCTGCGHVDTWMIALKFYTGPGTLIEQHRNGTLNWVANPVGINFAF